jgi:hypothetical protein
VRNKVKNNICPLSKQAYASSAISDREDSGTYLLLGGLLPSSDESGRNEESTLYWAGWPFYDEELVQIKPEQNKS